MKGNTMTKLSALLLSLLALHAQADVLDDFSTGYAAGTLFADDSEYASVYARSHDRHLELSLVRDYPDYVLADFKADLVIDGRPHHEKGFVAIAKDLSWAKNFTFPDGYLTADPSIAGQAADVATTGAGLAAGLSEANPLGAVILPLKFGLYVASENTDFVSCFETKKALSDFGWAAGAWNLAMIAIGPAAPLFAVGGYLISNNSSWQGAALTCYHNAKRDKLVEGEIK